MTRHRIGLVALVSLVALLVPVAYVLAARQGPSATEVTPAHDIGAPTTALPDRPRLFFRSTESSTYGLLSAVPRSAPTDKPVATDRTCQRMDARAGRIVCVDVDQGFLDTVHARVLDEDLREVHELPLKGVPSRVRLSPDGTLVAVTVFVAGHSYTTAGFSTSTTIWDTGTGEQVAELERFRFRRDGEVVDAVDRNFWGVTFSRDGTTFYATMGTQGRTYLVRGALHTRSGETVTDGVECPALSPDETRVAFKQRRPGDVIRWTLGVLDLRTGKRTVLPVEGDVDDQPYWFDASTVAYGQARGSTGADAARQDTWIVAADGSAPPELLREDAWSLVVDG